MGRREREILEHGVHAIAEQTAKTNTVIDEAINAGLAADHPVTVAAKQVRLELLEDRPGAGTWGLGCLTASPAAWRSTGSKGSAWPTLGTGGIDTRRGTASRCVKDRKGQSARRRRPPHHPGRPDRGIVPR
jgi:hypothetical protein